MLQASRSSDQASRSSDAAWRDFYTAALFQDDVTKVPALITRAESEIVARAHSLFDAPGDNANEMRALDNALRMLQTLKSCVKTTTPSYTHAD
jgi:hypothetical protein